MTHCCVRKDLTGRIRPLRRAVEERLKVPWNAWPAPDDPFQPRAARRDRGQVTRALAGMQAAGLVETFPKPADGRSVLIGVTPHIEERLSSALRANAELATRLVGRFDEDELETGRPQ